MRLDNPVGFDKHTDVQVHCGAPALVDCTIPGQIYCISYTDRYDIPYFL